ncbi:MAG: 50S ribosomal protein L17 [Vampirovibrionales bacterium]|nr:50S ribosomal protein L17 [Vampirovibrionales bacterium]
MRHRNRVKKLGLPVDQRKALMRSLATQLFLHGEIETTVTRAKVLVSFASPIVTYAKRGNLNDVRMASKRLYKVKTGQVIESAKGNPIEETVLRKIFAEIGPRYADRQGGYIRVLKTHRRRGDNTQMAIVQLV